MFLFLLAVIVLRTLGCTGFLLSRAFLSPRVQEVDQVSPPWPAVEALLTQEPFFPPEKVQEARQWKISLETDLRAGRRKRNIQAQIEYQQPIGLNDRRNGYRFSRVVSTLGVDTLDTLADFAEFASEFVKDLKLNSFDVGERLLAALILDRGLSVPGWMRYWNDRNSGRWTLEEVAIVFF